nr:uncharacterized protein LOC111993657 [Quercus suber]
MCNSKSQGGMGFRNLHAFNLAMLAKEAWRIFTRPDSLISKIYKARYFPFSDVINAQLGCNPSYAWRSIHSSLEVIRRGTRWRVGNGKTIHIWEDKWLPTPTTYKTISPPYYFEDFPMVSVLIDLDSKRWKADLVKKIFLPFEADTILRIPLCYSLPDDKLIWLGNTRGVFTVRSAYYVALSLVKSCNRGESSAGDSRSLLWKRVWHLNLPEKIRIFAWRACMDALPTMQNLKLVWNFWVGKPAFLDGGALDVTDVALHVKEIE